MSKQASKFQKVVMSAGYRGKEIFKPLNTGRIDEHVSCIREYIANIFFYTKNGTTIMIDAGYSYERLREKMGWLDIDPADIHHILITHQDTDHVGAVEVDSDHLFDHAMLYIGEIENRYLTGEVRRRVAYGTYKLPMVNTANPKVLLNDGDVFYIQDIKIEALLVPGHTWGHMVYLIDDTYLFTGDTLWFGADGGYSFINGLAEDNELAMRSLEALEQKLRLRGISPKIITGHTGWTDSLDFAFAHRDEVCNGMKKQWPHDPSAPVDGYDESDDTEEGARQIPLEKVSVKPAAPDYPDYKNWVPMGMITGFGAGAAALGAGAFLLGRKAEESRLARAAAIAAGTGAAASGAVTAWCIYAHEQFSYTGKRQLSRGIIEGTADYISLPEGGVGLDVGCGSGALTIACAKRNPQARMVGCDRWGAEYASFSRRLCDQNALAEGVDNVTFQKGDACCLPFEAESFDAVTSNYVYHNISGKDKQDLLLETLRVLKPGGTFAIHDIMSPARYGDMEAFRKKLLSMGYQEVRMISTSDGLFMSRAEAASLFLTGSTLLYGRK